MRNLVLHSLWDHRIMNQLGKARYYRLLHHSYCQDRRRPHRPDSLRSHTAARRYCDTAVCQLGIHLHRCHMRAVRRLGRHGPHSLWRRRRMYQRDRGRCYRLRHHSYCRDHRRDFICRIDRVLTREPGVIATQLYLLWHSPSSVPHARCSPSWHMRCTQPLAPSQNVPAGQGALLSATPSQLLSRPSQISSAGFTAFSQGSQALLRHSCVPARHSPSSVPHARCSPSSHMRCTQPLAPSQNVPAGQGALLSATPSQLLSRPSQISSAGFTAFSQGSQALLRHSCVPSWHSPSSVPHARCSPSWQTRSTQPLGPSQNVPAGQGALLSATPSQLLSRPSQISSAGLTAFSQGSQALLRQSCVPARHSPSSVPHARCSPSWQTRSTQPLGHRRMYQQGRGRCCRLRHHSYCRDHRRPHRPD